MLNRFSTITLLCALVLGTAASAQEQDIMIQSVGGQLVTGFANLDTNQFTSPTLVYTRQLFPFGTDWFNTNPGFYSLQQGSVLLPSGVAALPSNLDLYWDFLPMTFESSVSNLFYWDGLDADQNGLTVDDVMLTLPLSALELRLDSPGTGAGFGSASVTGTPDFVVGKKIARTAFDGSIHQHGVWELFATVGAAPPAQGVYLLSMQVRIDGALATSDPFFMAFRTGGIPTATEQVIADWVRQNVDMLIGPPTLAGDFNGDRLVDAADYTVWRDTLGSMSDLEADADDSGQIDAVDYAIWRENFGQSLPPADVATSQNAVPEPASLYAAALLIIGACCIRQRL